MTSHPTTSGSAACRPGDACVVAYHEFALAASRDVYQLTPALFARHLATLAPAAERSGRKLCVTFDDVHRSQVELAAPVLERAGLRGRFFAPAGWVGVRPGIAGWSELRHLVAGGHRIGSHGHTHALLTGCTAEALRDELVRSRETLEDRLDCEVRTLSLPGGRCNRAVLLACQAAGYHEVYTSHPSPAPFAAILPPAGDGPFRVYGRLVVRRSTRLGTLAGYAAQARRTAALLAAEHSAKRLLKQVVGDAAYQAAWRRLLRAPIDQVSFGGR